PAWRLNGVFARGRIGWRVVGKFLQRHAPSADSAADVVHLSFPKRFRGAAMIRVESIDQLAQRLAGMVPPGMAQAREDLEANFRDVLAHGLRRLDLVTREEFDVQRMVLARTRERLEAL